MSQFRREVLAIFKQLHVTRKKICNGDENALTEARTRINEAFKTNKNVTDPRSISELIKHGQEVELIFRTQVVQVKEKDNGNFELNLTEDTLLMDNKPYNDNAVVDKPRPPNKRCKK